MNRRLQRVLDLAQSRRPEALYEQLASDWLNAHPVEQRPDSETVSLCGTEKGSNSDESAHFQADARPEHASH